MALTIGESRVAKAFLADRIASLIPSSFDVRSELSGFGSGGCGFVSQTFTSRVAGMRLNLDLQRKLYPLLETWLKSLKVETTWGHGYEVLNSDFSCTEDDLGPIRSYGIGYREGRLGGGIEVFLVASGPNETSIIARLTEAPYMKPYAPWDMRRGMPKKQWPLLFPGMLLKAPKGSLRSP